MSTNSEQESQNARSSQFNNDAGDEDDAQRSVEIHEVKKTSAVTKVILASAAVLVLGVIAVFGLSLMSPAPQKPQEANAPKVEPPAPAINEPAVSQPEQTSTVEPPVASTTVDPLASNDPLASLGGTPLNAPPASPETSQEANDPLASLGGTTSVTPASNPAPAVTQTQPQSSDSTVAPQPAVTPPAVTTPSLNNTGSTADLAQAVGSAVTAAIRPVVERIDSMETKFDNRLTALETGKPVVAKETPVSNEVKAPARKPVVRKPVAKKKAAPKPSKNTIEILDASPSVVSTSTPVSSNPAKTVDKSECRVSAVLDGVAWLKSSDGKFTAVSTGDSLPDGRKATSITAEKGIVVNGKAWNCD